MILYRHEIFPTIVWNAAIRMLRNISDGIFRLGGRKHDLIFYLKNVSWMVLMSYWTAKNPRKVLLKSYYS